MERPDMKKPIIAMAIMAFFALLLAVYVSHSEPAERKAGNVWVESRWVGGGHKVLIAISQDDMRSSSGVSMIHHPACPCKGGK